VVYGSSTLAISTYYVQEHQEQLPIMPQLVNIDLGFSPVKISAALVSNILSKQDVTFYTSAKGLTNTGIREETLLVTLLRSLN